MLNCPTSYGPSLLRAQAGYTSDSYAILIKLVVEAADLNTCGKHRFAQEAIVTNIYGAMGISSVCFGVSLPGLILNYRILEGIWIKGVK